jgi:hypothetical protein
MVPQSNWPSSASNYSKHVSDGQRGWWGFVPTVVALGVFAYSSHGLAGDRIGGAKPQLPQVGEEQALDRAQPTLKSTEQGSTILPRAEASRSSWVTLIQNLLSSPERASLAAGVGELLRQGDSTGAQQMLSAAVDLATFAIIIGDGIQDPDLQGILQAIARERQDTRLAQGVPAGDAEANASKAGEQGNGAESERMRAEAALQELHAVQGQLAALREKEVRVVELERALEQEKGRTASAIQDLSLVQEQLAAVTRSAIGAADTRDEHAREVEKGKAALLELTVQLTEAQEQLAALKASAAEAAELRGALERERGAARSAARETEALKGELVALQTSGANSTGAASSAAEEAERADAASQQLEAVQNQLSALQESEAKMQEELKQERQRSASAKGQITASEQEILALRAQLAGAAAIQEALRQEKESTVAALRDLHALQRQIADLEMRGQVVPAALLFQTTLIRDNARFW